VDAAKEVRENWEGTLIPDYPLVHTDDNFAGYKKKVRRLVRRSAEEAWD
jgi:hypothetical protein